MKERIIGITLLIVVCLIFVLLGILAFNKDTNQRNAKLSCYSYGYTELKGRIGNWYCIKRSLCEDVVVPLKSLEGK